MERTIHECLLLDKTSGWITQILEDDEKEIKANMDWNTNGARIHFESGFREYPKIINWKKVGTQSTAYTTVVVSLIDDKSRTKYTYVLRNRNYTNGPTLQYLSRTGNKNHNIETGSEEYYNVLSNIAGLLDDKNMDPTTAGMLAYMLDQMQQEKCDNTSCPEFLSYLVELGRQQQAEKLKQRQSKSTFQKTLEQLHAPYKKEGGNYKNATYPPIDEDILSQ